MKQSTTTGTGNNHSWPVPPQPEPETDAPRRLHTVNAPASMLGYQASARLSIAA
jgi:hypothetical protein